MWGMQEETHTFTIITSFNYLLSITRKNTCHMHTHNAFLLLITLPTYTLPL